MISNDILLFEPKSSDVLIFFRLMIYRLVMKIIHWRMLFQICFIPMNALQASFSNNILFKTFTGMILKQFLRERSILLL